MSENPEKFSDDIGKDLSETISQLSEEINTLTVNLERQNDVETPDKLPPINVETLIFNFSEHKIDSDPAGLKGNRIEHLLKQKNSESNLSYTDLNDEIIPTTSHSRDMDDIIQILNCPSKTETIHSSSTNKRVISDYMVKTEGDFESRQQSIFSASTLSASPGRRNINSTFSTGDFSDAASLLNNFDESEEIDEERNKSKITQLLYEFNNRYKESSVETDLVDEWEDDDDTGYLVINLTEDEFFDMEEEATRNLLEKKSDKRPIKNNLLHNINDDDDVSLDGGSEIYEVDSMTMDLSQIENVLVSKI